MNCCAFSDLGFFIYSFFHLIVYLCVNYLTRFLVDLGFFIYSFFHLIVYLCVNYLSLSLTPFCSCSLRLTVGLSDSLSVSVWLSVSLYACLSVCQSVSLYVYLSLRLSVCMSVCLSVYLCLSVSLSFTLFLFPLPPSTLLSLSPSLPLSPSPDFSSHGIITPADNYTSSHGVFTFGWISLVDLQLGLRSYCLRILCR